MSKQICAAARNFFCVLFQLGNTPLILACESGCIEVVKLLLSHNANIHASEKVSVLMINIEICLTF